MSKFLPFYWIAVPTASSRQGRVDRFLRNGWLGLGVLFLSAVVPAPAQNALWIDLSGEWRTLNGDDPRYALAEFDDSAWAKTNLPAGTRGPRVGITWLRRQVNLPPGTDGSQLAITVGALRDVFEIYSNGRMIGSSGSFASYDQVRLPRPLTFPVTATSQTLLIAIRVKRRLGSPGQWIQADQGPWVLTSTNAAPLRPGEAQLNESFVTQSAALPFATAFFLCGGLTLVVWLSDRSRRELLWFSVFAIAKAVGVLYTFALLANPESTPWNADGFHWQFYIRQLDAPASAMLTVAILRLEGRWIPLLALLSCLPTPIAAWLHFSIATTRDLNWWTQTTGPVLSGGAILWHWLKGRSELSSKGDQWLRAILFVYSLDAVQTRIIPLVGLPRIIESFVFTVGGFAMNRGDIIALLVSLAVTWLLLRRFAGDRQEKQRLAAELGAARVVQQLLLPDAAASTGSFILEAVYEPALEVGGDFYWTRLEADGALLVAVGDVSGKGLKAAMLVSLAIGILRTAKSPSPAGLLTALNDGLAGRAGGGFITCCCARFEVDGTVTIANAGHPSPYADGRELEVEAGLPLGVLAGAEYGESMATGDRFTFVSDGVVEAENAQRELFGFERTLEMCTKPAAEIAAAAKAWGQTDDITVVTVGRKDRA